LTEIFLLLAAVLATIVLARRTSPTAGWLLVPYLAWAGFAAWLNYAIWRLNG
jgi:tryptophan-rich sensory protein